jgi:hypothetical protein
VLIVTPAFMPPTDKRALTASLASWIRGLALKEASYADVIFHSNGKRKMQGRVLLKKTMPRSSSASTLERVAAQDESRDRCVLQTDRIYKLTMPEWTGSEHRIEKASEGFFGACRDAGALEEKQRGFAPACGNIQGAIEPDRLAKTCSETRFFASTFWARSSVGKASGGLHRRFFKTPLFQTNCLGDWIEMGLAKPHEWIAIVGFGLGRIPVSGFFVQSRCASRRGDLKFSDILPRL